MNYSIDKRLKALEQNMRHTDSLKQEISSIDISNHIADIFEPVHEDICSGAHTFYNLRGGRGSGKSSFISLELILQIMTDDTGLSNAICIRKWAVTLRQSVFSQLQWAINELRVGKYWKSTLNPMQFTYKPTGQVIRLTGLDDPTKLKSIKPARGYFKYLWIEEFSEISGEPELRSLQQSILRGGDSFCVLRSWNPPISKSNWTNLLCERPDKRSVSMMSTYLDIPSSWLGDTFIEEAEQLKEINLKAYQHEFLGLPVGQGAEVFGENLEVRTITDEEYQQCDKIHSGVDWGFSQDPAVFLRVNYEPKTETVMILDEIYEKHLSNAELVEKIQRKGWDKTGNYAAVWNEIYEQKALIIADAAEPKSIADCQKLGLKMIECHKFQGCIQYRIRWLQHRRIIVDPKRTPNTARELQNLSYDIDKRTGEVLNTIPDRDNHTSDALAYALDRQIYNRKYSA